MCNEFPWVSMVMMIKFGNNFNFVNKNSPSKLCVVTSPNIQSIQQNESKLLLNKIILLFRHQPPVLRRHRLWNHLRPAERARRDVALQPHLHAPPVEHVAARRQLAALLGRQFRQADAALVGIQRPDALHRRGVATPRGENLIVFDKNA